MNLLHSSARKRLIKQFGEKLGFVYFGHVDQHTDDHRVVRGFSSSVTHKDTNYMVGSYEDVDITIVDRADRIDNKLVQWFIADFNLGKDTIPHFFLMPKHQKESHYKKLFIALRKLDRLYLHNHSSEFSQRYEVYCTPENSTAIEEVLTPEVTRTFAAHFWPLAVEVWDGTLFLYSGETKLTEHHLNTIIKNGTWLSQVLTSQDQTD